MKELTIIETAVLDLIPVGSIRKVSIREIGKILDLDERSIYEIINSLRRKGVPVCAKRNGNPIDRGYYIATNEEERATGIHSYKSQVKDMSNLINTIEQADLINWRKNLKKAE
jgi:predicted transcriptional regulator